MLNCAAASCSQFNIKRRTNKAVPQAVRCRCSQHRGSRALFFYQVNRPLFSLPMFFSSRRPLLIALSLSVLLHTVLLLGVVPLLPLSPEVQATAMMLVVNGRAAGPSENSPKASPARPPAAALKPSSADTRKTRLPAMTQAMPSPVVQAPDVAVVTNQAAPSRSATPAVAAGGAASPAADLPASPSGAVSADDMRQYRIAIASAARHFKRYPALARERGWEGVAEVGVSIHARLPAPEISLARSSGRSLLDEQALEMISRAVQMSELPAALKGRDFRFVVPVRFSLENDQ